MFIFSFVENIQIVISELNELMYTMKPLRGILCVLCNHFCLKSLLYMVYGLSYVIHIIGR